MLAMQGGALWWLANCNESVDLNNDLIIFDISQLADNIKNAMSILIMGAVSTRYFPKPNDGTKRRRTYLFFDELGKLLQTPEMIPHIERGFKEARASFITTVVCTQDPEIDERVLKIIKVNCSNIFLLSNLKESSIDIFEKVFCLNERHKPRLMQKGQGIGLYIREPYATNIRISLTGMEEKALLQSEGVAEIGTAEVRDQCAFSLDKNVQWIRDEHGFICENWTEGETTFPSYECYNVTDCFGSGTVNVWIDKDRIEKAKDEEHKDKALNQGYKHYAFACQLAGEIVKMGFPEEIVKINHYNDVDISVGDFLGIKIEMPESKHTKKDWLDKKQSAVSAYPHVIFTCPGDLEKDIKNAIGKAFVFPRGNKLKRELEKCKSAYLPHSDALLEPTKERTTPD
jgi:hypothetical protein